MSCGQIALSRLGVEYDKYFASEVDKYAIKVTRANYPETIHIGDVRFIDIETVLKLNGETEIDLLIGGSPCQGFSVAGNKLNFDDERSKLFFEYVRVLECVRRVNPHVKFILENVKMKKEYRDIISKHLGVEPIEIDSALLSAQSRKRLYWTNIPDVVQPEEKWVSFHSILESGCALSDKAYALTHSYYKKGGEGTRLRCLARSQRPIVIIDGNHSRWLTPIECERLQTVPDNYTNHVSNTQRYRMLGNGMTVDVIAHILKGVNRGK
jgi:site-specific DNA-cytosine methylase